MSQLPSVPSASQSSATGSSWRAVGRRVLFELLTRVAVPIVIGLIVATLFLKVFRDRLSTLTIPVFITGQDNQGGQFALGVSRAVNWAERFKLDEVDGRHVRPLFLNEDDLRCPNGDAQCEAEDRTAALLAKFDEVKSTVPIVVGPLTSTHALDLVPAVADQRGIPMILGIPTNTRLTEMFSRRVWRLSPTDDSQADTVANTLRALAPNGERSMIVADWSGNNIDYSKPLAEAISSKANALPLQSQPRKFIFDGTNLGEFEEALRTYSPTIIVYVGMPEQARKILGRVDVSRAPMTVVFTDGCVDLGFLDTLKSYPSLHPGSKFFVTFQAPPPSLSAGIRSYIWFTRSMGGSVTGVSDQDCGIKSAATSYEVFGFDSYMIALNLVHESKLGTPASVEGVMKDRRAPDWPFLLMPYRFDDYGNNQSLSFHVYEVRRDGCPTHSGQEDGGTGICPSDNKT